MRSLAVHFQVGGVLPGPDSFGRSSNAAGRAAGGISGGGMW
jgi:hypothetical protein